MRRACLAAAHCWVVLGRWRLLTLFLAFQVMAVAGGAVLLLAAGALKALMGGGSGGSSAKGASDAGAGANGAAVAAEDAASKFPAGVLRIFFGSQTGKAQAFAKLPSHTRITLKYNTT